jgi:hypothetical protein
LLWAGGAAAADDPGAKLEPEPQDNWHRVKDA